MSGKLRMPLRHTPPDVRTKKDLKRSSTKPVSVTLLLAFSGSSVSRLLPLWESYRHHPIARPTPQITRCLSQG